MFGIGYSQVSILLFVVLIPVLHLLLGVWIGNDAARWGESGAVWAVGTLVGGMLGPALSLALRKPASASDPISGSTLCLVRQAGVDSRPPGLAARGRS